MPLDRETLGRLQQLHQEATAGPWQIYGEQRRDAGCNCVTIDLETGETACPIHGTTRKSVLLVLGHFCIPNQAGAVTAGRTADRALVAASRNALPDLLAAAALGLAVQGLRERIETGLKREAYSDYGECWACMVLRDLLALLDAPAGAR